MEFGATQVIDIIFNNQFPIDPTFQVLEFNDEDEEDDSSSIKPNTNMKKGQ